MEQSELKEWLHYDPLTGLFTWLKSNSDKIKVGQVAGCKQSAKNSKGVRVRTSIAIRINKRSYLAHRLAFIYMTGELPNNVVDHIDHNPWNNKWSNLRDVTHKENCKNSSIKSTNTSGHVGVRKDTITGKWRSCIKVDGANKSQGCFETFDEAVNARNEASEKYGFHENHGIEQPVFEKVKREKYKPVELTHEVLKERLEYNPDTGVFIWKAKTARNKIGQRAGSEEWYGKNTGRNGKYRVRIKLLSKNYAAHRLAWFYMTGEWPNVIDHIDGNPFNNTWNNLRDVTNTINCQNLPRRSDNTSGVTGVIWRSSSNVWCADITVNGTRIFLGSDKDKDHVIKLRKDAEIKYGFHKNHGREVKL